MKISIFIKYLLCLMVLASLGGCAAQRAFNDGRDLIERGDTVAGVAKIEEATRLDPSSNEYKLYLVRQRDSFLQRWAVQAEEARSQGKYDEAENYFKKMLELDHNNARAVKGLEFVAQGRRLQAILTDAEGQFVNGDVEGAYNKVRSVLARDPNSRGAQALLRKIDAEGGGVTREELRLKDSFRKPMSMEFRDASLRQVFELISRNTGMNFLFDRDVKPDLRTTLMVKDTTAAEIVRFLLVTNQLDQKILNESTVLIYPATQAKQHDYQDLMTKSFFVGNANVKDMVSAIKSILKVKDVYADEKLNIITLRETPGTLRAVERLLANHDLAEPEVVLEMEVLELSSTLTTSLGINYPTQLSASVAGAAGTAGTVTLKEALARASSLVSFSISDPALSLNLTDQLAKTNILANPRIRVKNKEKAQIHVGDKVPVVSTTTTSTGVIAESVSYLDTGLKLEATPEIHLDDEVEIKIALEVSNISKEVTTSSGTLTYQLGTRNASTVLRLKDGETQMLAGLISDEDRDSTNRIPGLGSLPIAGHLFGSQSGSDAKTEIVLLVTPHVVRNIIRPDPAVSAFMSGTEGAAGAPELVLQPIKKEVVVDSEVGKAAAASTYEKIEKSDSVPKPRVMLLAPQQVVSGQPFKVLVNLDSSQLVSSAIIELVFDADRFKVVDTTEGALIKSVPDSNFHVSSANSSGRIAISVSPKSPITGQGEIAVLTLEANTVRPMSSALRVEKATLIDLQGKPIIVDPGMPTVMTLIN
jgi:general secretion pathway protein D